MSVCGVIDVMGSKQEKNNIRYVYMKPFMIAEKVMKSAIMGVTIVSVLKPRAIACVHDKVVINEQPSHVAMSIKAINSGTFYISLLHILYSKTKITKIKNATTYNLYYNLSHISARKHLMFQRKLGNVHNLRSRVK